MSFQKNVVVVVDVKAVERAAINSVPSREEGASIGCRVDGRCSGLPHLVTKNLILTCLHQLIRNFVIFNHVLKCVTYHTGSSRSSNSS